MKKRCEMCGCIMDIPDWYAYIRTKYCKRCASDMKRRQNAEWAREFRKKNRERNALTRELCAAQAEEIKALRALVIRQREEMKRMMKE